MFNHMYPSADVDELIGELEHYNYTVVITSNMTHRDNKTPLPLFLLEFQPQDDKNVNNIWTLLYMVVAFEAPHKKRSIPQYTRYQAFSHTRCYCH